MSEKKSPTIFAFHLESNGMSIRQAMREFGIPNGVCHDLIAGTAVLSYGQAEYVARHLGVEPDQCNSTIAEIGPPFDIDEDDCDGWDDL